MFKNKNELEEYLKIKNEEILQNKIILENYLSQKSILLRQQEALEKAILRQNDDKERNEYISQLREVMLDMLGVLKEITYTKNLLSNLEYDIDICKKELKCF